MRERADLIVFGGAVATLDAQRNIISDGAVVVRQGRIAFVGKAAQAKARYVAERKLGGPDKFVFPGLVDGHNHPVHFLSKGMIDDMPLPERWRTRVWPYEASIGEEETELACTGTFLEMVRRGTTCFVDPGSLHPDAVGRAALRVGIRGILSRLTWDVRDASAPDYHDDTEMALEKAETVVDRWEGAGEGRLRAWFSLVRSSHVSEELVERIRTRAAARGVGVQSHLATTRAEYEAARSRWGTTPVGRYRDLGLLESNAYLVHMGWISDGDVELLKAHDVSVCHCPSASMLGGFGCVAHGRFPELVESGVRVTLGSDACAISRFLDMARIMYLAACAHKDVKTDPTVIGAHKAFEMATIDAAAATGWEREIGSLEIGKQADIVIADTDGIEWQPNPLENPVANFIYSSDGSAIRTVLIGGRIIMEDRVFPDIDLSQFYAQAGDASRAILQRMNAGVRRPWPLS